MSKDKPEKIKPEKYKPEKLAKTREIEQKANQSRVDAKKLKTKKSGRPELIVREKNRTLKMWYGRRSEKFYELWCTQHDGAIAVEAVMKEYKPIKRTHSDDAIVVPLKNDDGDFMLLASRLREDGTMGYQCSCGADTRLLPEESELMEYKAMLPHIKESIKQKIKDRKSGGKKMPELFERRKVKG